MTTTINVTPWHEAWKTHPFNPTYCKKPFPVLKDPNFTEPLKGKLPELDEDVIRAHEQLYRAVEQILVEEGFDAIFYGTAGVEGEGSFRPAVVVMIGCEKYAVTFYDYDVIVIRQPLRVRYDWMNPQNSLFGTPLQDPDSMEYLVRFLRTL